MKILDKYKALRPQIDDGDIIIFHGSGLMAKLIQFCDSSYYNHVGIVIKSHEALFIVDSNANGVQSDRLSYRMLKYKGDGDFTILKPNLSRELIDQEMCKILHTSDDKWIKYDFINGTKELCNRKIGTKFKINLDCNRHICSDYVSRYAINLNMVNDLFKKLIIAFPEDYKRYVDLNNTQVIG